jgi:hypothetical protein
VTANEHDELVDRLTIDLAPVMRPWSPWARLACWVGLALGTVAAAAVVGLRDDLAVQIERPGYLTTIAVLLAGAGLAATAAFLVAVPGRIALREADAIGAGLLALAVAAAPLGDRVPATSTTAFVFEGLRCTVCIAAFGLLPWLVLFRALRRSAPLDGRTAGLCAGAAACLVGAAAVRVACPVDDMIHLAIWHAVPVVVWTFVSARLGGALLGRWLDYRDAG